MSGPPARTDEQRAAALARAAEARRVRAELKDRIRAGEVDLPTVFGLAETDDHVARIKILTLLECLPQVGKVKSRRLLAEIGIAESRRVRGVGSAQRAALIEALPG